MESIAQFSSVSTRFADIRHTTVELCQTLIPEDLVVQPITDVSPPKWHLGHTTWFFEAFILSKYLKNYKLFNKDYNYLFNSYYESVGDRILRSHRGNLTRPEYKQILDYRIYVNNHMSELLEDNDNKEIFYLTELGLQHEQQHQELLMTDIKYILGNNPLFPPYAERETSLYSKGDYNTAKYIEIPGGIYETGYQGKNFCFDNELPLHKSYVKDFKVMDRLVTNREYLEFVKDDGYKDFRHWHMEGWEIVKNESWESPLYWIRKDDQWLEYTSEGLTELSMNAPVCHISFYEATAFAAWKGKRLITEPEWEAAVSHLKIKSENGNFLENKILQPQPASDSMQFFGDCWEWTYSAYLPYPGYRREEGALGEYNGKFMINQMVLKGGSCATPISHFRSSYRNFFHPDKRWQFTGIRLGDD